MMIDDRNLLEGGSSTEFEYYESTTTDPGWSFTILVMVICSALNLTLPVLVRIGKARRKEKNQTPDQTSSNPQTNAAVDDDNRNREPSVDDSDAISEISVGSSGSSVSMLSEIVAGVLEAKMKPNHKHFKYRAFTPIGPAARCFARSALDDRSVQVNDDLGTKEEHSTTRPNVPLAGQDEEDWRRWGLMESVLEIADFDHRTKHLLKLFFPYLLGDIISGIFEIIKIGLIGHFIGVQEANVKVVIDTMMEITDTPVYGFISAIGTLVPQADGAGNKILSGRYLQLSVIFYTIFSIPSLVVWGFWTDTIILWFGFDEETAAFAQSFVYPYLVGYVVGGLDECIYQFLEVIGHEKYAMILGILYSACQTGIYGICIASGLRDLLTIQIITAAWGIAVIVANLGFVVYRGWLDDYWEGLLRTFSLQDRRAVRTMTVTALPMSLSYLLTYGEWEVLTLFTRGMGPAEVAAWGLLGYVWDTFENMISALSEAAEVRVGFQLGEGRPEVAKMTAYKAAYLGAIIALFSTGLLFCVAEQVPRWLTPDPTIQRMIFETLPLMGFGQISMVVGNVLWNIVEAQGRVRLATFVEIVTSWGCVVPLSALSVYVFNFNLVGLMGALVVAYSLGGIWISYIVLTSDWKLQSQILIARHGSRTLPYHDYTWDRLPKRASKAAQLLGYTEASWNAKRNAPLQDKSTWDELNSEERNAARQMGYNKDIWESDELEDSQGKTRQNYDDYYWEELPPDVQAAAVILGYNKTIWDKDGTPFSDDKAWYLLTPAQQEAARTLGYNEDTWDDDSSSSSSSSSSRDDPAPASPEEEVTK